MRRAVAMFIVIGFALAGCGGAGNRESAKGTSSATEKHAQASVVPGSYEDWCGEHGVPESACTRCDPTLVPAFKATNDWCAEHNLPESQCKDCNPNLVINRPPKSGGR